MTLRTLDPRRTTTKPGRWQVTPHHVAPAWRWAWDGEVFWYPMWEGGGDTIRVYPPSDAGETGPGDATILQPDEAAWSPTRTGIGLSCVGSNTQGVVEPPSPEPGFWHDGFSTRCFFAYCRPQVPAELLDNYHCLIEEGGGGSGMQLAYDHGSDGFEFDRSSGGGLTVAAPLDEDYLVVGVYDAGDMELWIDGVLEAETSAGTSVGSHGSDPGFLGRDSGAGDNLGTDAWGGDCYYLGVATRRLLPAEIRQLARDPFGPFRRQRTVWVNVPSAEGAQTFALSWTESVAAEDSEDVAASLSADLEASAGARDVMQAAATLTGHSEFAAGASETMDAAARLTADVTETAGARDGGEDVVATLAASIAEGAEAGEEWATTLVASAETQETVGPTDSFDLPSDAITAALTEDSGAADTFAATLTALAHAVEEAGPEASFETTGQLTADYLETVGPGDVWTATASLQAGLTETVGAEDTLTVPREAVAAALTAAIEIAAKVAADIRAQAKTSADLDVEARVGGDIETN